MFPSTYSHRVHVSKILDEIDSIILISGRPDGFESKGDSLAEGGIWLEIRKQICDLYGKDFERVRI